MSKLANAAFVLIVGFVLLVTAVTSSAQSQSGAAYTLGVGDRVHVTVFNEPDLSGDFDVNDQGLISLPLIGSVRVAGMTMSQAQDLITQKYSANYLVNPRVNIDVLNYRPFYVLGEVQKPGSYPYVNGMTVLNAIALAGGYTPRGDKDDIRVKHSDASGAEQKIRENDKVLPGDIIQIKQRLF